MNYTLITGASGGIGRALAHEAAHDGRALILVARDEQALRAVANTLRTSVEIIACDLTAPDVAQTLYSEIVKRDLVVSELINNAGVGDYGAFHESDLQTQLRMMQLNMNATVELTHLFLPMIIAQRGRILNLGSIASFIPGPYMSIYFATKHFILNFSESLSEELKDKGVTVTCLCPGPVATHFGATAHVGPTHSVAKTTMAPETVAAYGWSAMQRGNTVAIHGLQFKLAVFFITRVVPRSLARRIVSRIQK